MSSLAIPAATAAQVHVPVLTLDRAERREGALRGARVGLGASLVAGTVALVLAAFMEVPNPIAIFVLPFAWVMGLVSAVVLAWHGSRHPLIATKVDAVSRALVYAGVGLVSPLTIHAAFAATTHFTDFTEWVRMSLVFVGPTHLAFAGLLAWRGVRGDQRPSLFAVWGAAVVVTLARMCFDLPQYGPYAFLPAAYVAATAIPILVGVKIVERVTSSRAAPSQTPRSALA